MELQVDYLKIDGSLIRKISEQEVARVIVRSIVTVAREFGARTVAEFVEDQRTADMARDLGVDYLQGYLYGKPAPDLRDCPCRQWPAVSA